MFALAARLVTQLAPETSQQYRRIAEDHVFQGGGSLRSDINIITALFLLSLHSHGEGKQRQAWVYCGVSKVQFMRCPMCSFFLPRHHMTQLRAGFNYGTRSRSAQICQESPYNGARKACSCFLEPVCLRKVRI